MMKVIYEVYRPFLVHFRRKRLKWMYATMGITAASRVLDVGGDMFTWQLAALENLPLPRLTILNVLAPPPDLPPQVTWVIADGAELPFADQAFETVVSNSVVEHLSTWDRQTCFAREVRRVGRRVFVQTPNRRFFVEPHLITPFVHWTPKRVQRQLLRWCTIWGLIGRPTPAECDGFLSEVRLLTRGELQTLFPNLRVVGEKFCGWAKSLIAVG